GLAALHPADREGTVQLGRENHAGVVLLLDRPFGRIADLVTESPAGETTGFRQRSYALRPAVCRAGREGAPDRKHREEAEDEHRESQHAPEDRRPGDGSDAGSGRSGGRVRVTVLWVGCGSAGRRSGDCNGGLARTQGRSTV